MFKLYIVNGYFLKKYRDFYKQYRKLMAEGTVPYSSFSRAIKSVLPVEPNVEEIALIRYSKKVHTTFNVNPKKIKGPVATTMSIAVLRAMARDMPEFKKIYEADLQEMKRELAEEEEEPKKEEEDKKEVAKQNVQRPLSAVPAHGSLDAARRSPASIPDVHVVLFTRRGEPR